MPLKKALTPLGGILPLKSHTKISASGIRNGTPFTLHEDLQIIARRPSRFHVKLTQYDALGAPQKQLIVITNGIEVWNYQPSTRQYSMAGYQDFEAANSDLPTLGLIVGGFYLGNGRPLIQGFHNLTPENTPDVLAALDKMDITLSRHAQSVLGHDDYVYTMTLAKQNLSYDFYVDSQTDTLKRIDLTTTQDDLQITFREDIVRIESMAPIPKAIFIFIPPLGTSKVSVLPSNPF